MTEDLASYIEDLRRADQENDREFSVLIARGLELLGLVDQDLARVFMVSIPTITRWRNGATSPHPLMRRPIYNWLEQRASHAN